MCSLNFRQSDKITLKNDWCFGKCVNFLPNASRRRKLTAKAFRLVALEESENKLKSNYLDSLFSPCYFYRQIKVKNLPNFERPAGFEAEQRRGRRLSQRGKGMM
jgi:hypothetical protein